MIKQVLPIQYGNGLQNYRWVIPYTDFNLAAANTTAQTLNLIDAQPSPPFNVSKVTTLPQGSLVIAYRMKATTAWVGTSITHVWFDLGYPANSAVSYSAAPHAINGGSGGASGNSYDGEAAVADANYQAGFAYPSTTFAGGDIGMAPGDAAFGLTVTATPVGANWTAITAGQLEVDLLLWIPSMGALWTSQYLPNPTPGNP